MKRRPGEHEALCGARAQATEHRAQPSSDVDAARLAGRPLARQRPTHAGRRVRVGGRLPAVAALEPVQLEVVLEMKRQLGERLEGGDEVEVQPVCGHVAAAGAEERRGRVVARDDRLLRLHVTQPEVQRLVAVTPRVNHADVTHS